MCKLASKTPDPRSEILVARDFFQGLRKFLARFIVPERILPTVTSGFCDTFLALSGHQNPHHTPHHRDKS